MSPVEYFAFMAAVEADEGKEKFHETVVNFIWEADINIMGMLPPADVGALKAKVKALNNAKLREYLFKAAIHQGSGDQERTYIVKKEIAYSKIGQLVLPFWDKLDADENGQVSLVEWNKFWDEVEASDLGKEMAADGESLIVDMFVDGGYDVGDVA